MNTNKQTSEEKPTVLGRSLRLMNGDLHFVEEDLAIVAGRDNFLQAMQVIIETPFSTDIFNVNYGFDLMNSISQPQSVRLIKELIRLNIVRSLSLDDRVREITEIVFDDEPRFFELNPQENTEGITQKSAEKRRRENKAPPRRWGAMVILQTIPEGEVKFKLEGVGI